MRRLKQWQRDMMAFVTMASFLGLWWLAAIELSARVAG